MSKKGLPLGLKMRHDAHYVEELTKSHQFIGRIIQIGQIEPNPDQPRVEMGDLSDLVASIKEKGVLEPLLVKPLAGLDKWLIIAGERRWRAAQMAGLTELPCIELNITEQEVAEIALIENLQRKDLTVWEEADAYYALCERFRYTHEDLAKKLGKSRSSVTETLTIASLPAGIRQRCIKSGISSKATILKVARKFDENEMLEEIERNLGQEFRREDVSFKTEKLSKTHSQKGVSDKINNSGEMIGGKMNLSFPLRVFKFNDENQNFKLEIKFKKPADVGDLKDAFNGVLDEINKINRRE